MSYPEWNELRETLLRGRRVPMINADEPTFMGQPHAISSEDLEDADVVIIGSPFVVSRARDRKYSGVDIMEWVAERISAYKKIREVEFVDNIPKSGSGKILRRELIQQEKNKLGS